PQERGQNHKTGERGRVRQSSRAFERDSSDVRNRDPKLRRDWARVLVFISQGVTQYEPSRISISTRSAACPVSSQSILRTPGGRLGGGTRQCDSIWPGRSYWRCAVPPPVSVRVAVAGGVVQHSRER